MARMNPIETAHHEKDVDKEASHAITNPKHRGEAVASKWVNEQG